MGLIDRRECCAKAALFDNYLAAIESLRADNNRLRAALVQMVEISQLNSEASIMFAAIRMCAEHALAADGKS